MMNKQYDVKTLVWFVVAIFAIILDIIIADYCNILSVIGFNMSNVNTLAISTLINATVTVGIFVFTYCMIQRWNLKKQENQEKIAHEILKKSYESCKSYLDILSKNDFQELLTRNNETSQNLTDIVKQIPFGNEDMLLPFCHEGIITVEELSIYLSIKNDYTFAVGEIKRASEEERNSIIEKTKESLENALRELQSSPEKNKKLQTSN